MNIVLQFFRVITPFERISSLKSLSCQCRAQFWKLFRSQLFTLTLPLTLLLTLTTATTSFAGGGEKGTSDGSASSQSRPGQKNDVPSSPHEPIKQPEFFVVDGNESLILEHMVVPVSEEGTSPENQYVDIIYRLEPQGYAVGEYVTTLLNFTNYHATGDKLYEYQSEFRLFPRGLRHKPERIIGMMINTTKLTPDQCQKTASYERGPFIMGREQFDYATALQFVSFIHPYGEQPLTRFTKHDKQIVDFGSSDGWGKFQDDFGRTKLRVLSPMLNDHSRDLTPSGEVIHFDVHVSHLQMLDNRASERLIIQDDKRVIATSMMELQSSLFKIIFNNPDGCLTCSINIPENYDDAKSIADAYGISAEVSSKTSRDAFKKTLKEKVHQELTQLLDTHEVSVHWVMPGGGQKQIYTSAKSKEESTLPGTYCQGLGHVKLKEILSEQKKHNANTVRFEISVHEKTSVAPLGKYKQLVSAEPVVDSAQLPILLHLFEQLKFQQQLPVSEPVKKIHPMQKSATGFHITPARSLNTYKQM